jgi:uncharacterized protein (TIGR02117 family)
VKNIRHDDRPALLRAGLMCFTVLLLTACSAAGHRPDPAPALLPGPTTKIYVLRRGWHTDIAFPADGIPGPLAGIARDFPGAQYLVFGFGDRRYQVSEHTAGNAALALIWPERGLVLVSALKNKPEEAFGVGNTGWFDLPESQGRAVADFVWQSLEQGPDGGVPHPYADGPYADSRFYPSTRVYAGVRTCNTWTAEALHAGGLPVQSFGVMSSEQVWMQLEGLRPES